MLNVCLIGAGRIGRIHAANLAANPRARLAAVVDVHVPAAEELAAAQGARALAPEQAFDADGLDAVIIASSTDTHHDLVSRAAARGLAILCEKPLDLDLDRASASVEVAARAGVPLFLGFNRRFDPSFRRVHDTVRGGGLGAIEVISITSRDPAPPPADYVGRSGGLFRDMMIHDLDMALWMLGEMPASVYASGACLVDPAIGEAGDIDTATVVLTTASGVQCQVTNSRRCAYGYDQRLEVFCAGGVARAGNETATTVAVGTGEGFVTEPALPFFLERYEQAYRLQLDAFIDAVGGHRDATQTGLATGEEAVQSLRLAAAAQRSLASGAAESP
ncbi:inositol 2-dehydrogenase [Marinihelvus fidelis]|uniref:Inositol 2-dehydrogenase n=1 Tax=Marinihelvus fidelis TaxID=2613842 RepID=A0A5N0TCP0_9GAMM|nr:inositol 2-dehydrogenase [Marinihelvus fidelis]KAA9131616.1 inositol 2-dehydrogenase [Marinihelvus fidelis]